MSARRTVPAITVSFLLALLTSTGYAAETPTDPACACHAGETDDERVARLETELRLAKAERVVNAGIAKAARKRVRRE